MAANVLIMAGGTGGHVFPALACALEFQARGYSVHWLGTPRGIENELVPAAGLPLHLIQVSGLRGKGIVSLIKAPLQLIRSLFQARRIVRELQPVCVLGMGGYVTGPGGLAAKLAGVPLVIHEQNAVAGTANRSLAPLSSRVCEAFPETFKASVKRRTTGNPVREELFLETPRDALAHRRPRLLVLGGSLGAEPLNKLLPAALAQVPADVRPQVFHQAGKQHADITTQRYAEVGVEAEVAPFIKDMARAYAWPIWSSVVPERSPFANLPPLGCHPFWCRCPMRSTTTRHAMPNIWRRRALPSFCRKPRLMRPCLPLS